MMYEQPPQGRDPRLWDIAKKRASFKTHLTTYLVVNAFFWALWFLTGGKTYGNDGVPWPVWPALGWGIGLVFHYYGTCINHGHKAVEKEYNKPQNKYKQ